MQYHVIPKIVEARQFTGDTANDMDIYLWVESQIGSFNPLEPFPDKGISIDPTTGYIFLATVQKVYVVATLDWIVRDSNGIFSVWKDKDFQEHFAPGKAKSNSECVA